ncbi:DUF4386 domain-containing protein [Planomonospora venezuelensis]|uniref:DUF4386 domain-containing protein n=1 Tax=Planomonospora venezuelensis TaxID=1999 RepID=A0A841D6W7_PLAVE|nr:hypothetical protein [Planomonospora venezuelensis]GIN03060.1 hypothetical protein Pve01_47180 [Planomonospora venezuelensis]
MTHPRTIARISGLLYLTLVVLGVWAQFYSRGPVYVPGDAAATAANIADRETLFRLGLAADILMATTFIALGLALHRLLHPAHPRAATALLTLVIAGAGGILALLTFHAGALVVATDPVYASGAGAAGRDSLALLMLDLHHHGYVLGGVLFGLWLLPMGYVAYRSSMFPDWLGVLLVIGCLTWIADPLIAFALPDAPDPVRVVVSLPTSAAEFGLMLYLIIRGVRTPSAAAHPAS